MSPPQKVHLITQEPGERSACKIIDPGLPPELYLFTNDPEKVTCGGCKHTNEWLVAYQQATGDMNPIRSTRHRRGGGGQKERDGTST